MALSPGGYQRLRRLGRGASGDVWEVRAPHSGERLALKEMNFSGMTSRERELVLQEARLLRRLSHPHIVRFVDLVVEDCFVCIVMQYIDGGDMRSLLAKRRESREQLLEADIWQWLLQIASALLYLHKAKILHRDVKPANIFLTAHSQKAILGDLGIAKVLDYTEARAVTQIGTPGYLAPEVWMGQRYSYAADIYSLGCTVYELAELRMPFVANDRAVLAAQACHRRCAPITNKSYSRSFRSLVQLMLEKDPLLRPSPAQVLLYAERVSHSGGQNSDIRDQSATRPPVVRNAGANAVVRGAAPMPAAALPSERRRSPLRRRALSPASVYQHGVDLVGGSRPCPEAPRHSAASPSPGRLSPLQRRLSPTPSGCGEPALRRHAAAPSERRASPLRRHLSPPPLLPSRGHAVAPGTEAVPPLPSEQQVRNRASPTPPGAGTRRSPRSGLHVSAAIDAIPGCREGTSEPSRAPSLRARPCPAPVAPSPVSEQHHRREPLIGTRPGTRERGRSAPRGHAPRSPRQRSTVGQKMSPQRAPGSSAPPGAAQGGPPRSKSPEEQMPPRAPSRAPMSAHRVPPEAPGRPSERARGNSAPSDSEMPGWGSVVPWRDRVDMSTFNSFLADTNEQLVAQEPGEEIYETTLMFDEVLREVQLSGLQSPTKKHPTPTAALSTLPASPRKGSVLQAVIEDVPTQGILVDIESTVMLLRSVLQVLPDECD